MPGFRTNRRRSQMNSRLAADLFVPSKGIDPWLAHQGSRCFSWDFACHGLPLPTNRSRFIRQAGTRSIRRSSVPAPALEDRKHRVAKTAEDAPPTTTCRCPSRPSARPTRQGYAINKKYVSPTPSNPCWGTQDKLLSSKISPNPGRPARPAPPRGAAEPGGFRSWPWRPGRCASWERDPNEAWKLIAEAILNKQPDGSWEFFATLRRPPINESQTTDAAWVLVALEGESGPDAPEAQRAALKKALAWLDAAKPSRLPSRQGHEGADGARCTPGRVSRCKPRSTSCWHCNAPTAAGARPSLN